MSGYTTAVTMAGIALSTGMGVYGSIQNGRMQSAANKAQAEAARQNRELAEQQAAAERKEAYDAAVQQRQEVAKLVGKQRAAAGASGAVVDFGSNADLQADTVAQGEMDAINIQKKKLDAAYNTEIQAMNYGNQASAFDSAATNAKQQGYMNALGAAVGGIAQAGTAWSAGQKMASNAAQGKYFDKALGQNVSAPVRH